MGKVASDDIFKPSMSAKRNSWQDKRLLFLHLSDFCAFNTLRKRLWLDDVAMSRANVLITNFCDFDQFSAKIGDFSTTTNAMIKFLHN
jgi:hypothetical protein